MASPPPPWFIVIGASGREGLDDIRDLLRELPSSLFAVVLIVLHRPWHQISRLQTVLARESQLPVVIATHGERFEPGTVYIGEPEDHLTLATNSFGFLVHDPERQYGNRTVDLLFQSVAAHGGERVLGVILSGSLDDGSRGLAAIHHSGGLTMVLSRASHTRGMPEYAIAYDGPVDVIGDLRRIAGAIQDTVRNGSNV
jgi:two-component system, chemotaxis family, protein-glutamate methylesterase/glutaminase